MDTGGNREVRGLGGHRQYTGGGLCPSLQSPELQEEAELRRAEGRGQREAGHQQGEPQGQGPVPRCVTWNDQRDWLCSEPMERS